ncbi:MAG: ROK family protein [bacterium]|jgi:glucokinase|nr:ROK family protein [candidate division KSB1 bacterium]MDH7559406.1 ROK family protein [bacterium]
MKLIIGLDLGGTFLKSALGDMKGRLLQKGKRPSEATAPADVIFENMFAAVEELLVAAEQYGGVVQAVGVGSPGVIDVHRGRLVGQSPNLPHWANVEIAGRMACHFGLPTFADNDANLMTLAEVTVGAAKGCRHVVCLTVGTGIGGGLYLNGEIYRGNHFAGAELGHTLVEFNGRPCPCGGRGCLEQYASAPATVREYTARLQQAGKPVPSEVDAKLVFERAKLGEPEAVAAVELTSQYLGAGIASFANALNPEMVVIGGGVADAGPFFIDRVAQAVRERAMPTAWKGLQIRPAELGNDAGVIGAILLAAQILS